MKKLILLSAISLASSSYSQTNYETVKKENKTLQSSNKVLKSENENWSDENIHIIK